ncbi:hypothetical protein [Colletotrichum gloeosporioides polymycovirus virus 1]|nr:hypothetical protein [Colletotrichum gloeosporioides polymycovirus virus 1]
MPALICSRRLVGIDEEQEISRAGSHGYTLTSEVWDVKVDVSTSDGYGWNRSLVEMDIYLTFFPRFETSADRTGSLTGSGIYAVRIADEDDSEIYLDVSVSSIDTFGVSDVVFESSRGLMSRDVLDLLMTKACLKKRDKYGGIFNHLSFSV